MASITERKGSGDGDSIGSDDRRRTRSFNLFVDAVTDDWHAKFIALLPLKSVHPKDRGMTCSDHVNVSRESPLGYIVTAIYTSTPRVGVSGFGSWLISVASNTGAERLFQEIPDAEESTIPRKVVGPQRYAKYDDSLPGPAPENVFYAKTIKDDRVVDQALVAIDGVHRPDGMDVVGGGSTITLKHQFSRMNALTILRVANFKKSVNFRSFIDRTFPEGTLLFTDYSIDETIGRLSHSKVDQFLYDVSLQFVYREEGHTPLRRTDTFIDDAGFESPVTTDSGGTDEVQQEFRRYVFRDFNQLVGLFNYWG